MIKVTFKEPQKCYDFNILPPLTFMANFVFCKKVTYLGSNFFDIIQVNNDHLHISKDHGSEIIQSIEHVKPTDL